MGKFDGILILSDMDGTLLNSSGLVSIENREAIRYFMENGGYFTVATGRSKAGMEHFLTELPINAPAVIYNGSVVYDFRRDAPVWICPVGEDGYHLAKAVMTRFPDVGVEIYDLHHPYVAQESFITRRHFTYVKMAWDQRDPEHIPQPWLNLLLTREADKMPELRTFVEKKFPGMFFLQYSAPYYLEVEHRLANKGAGALRLRDWLDIDPGRLYTVGDGTNDIELLSCACRPFAPENACPEVYALSPGLLPDCDHHAIAALVDRIEKGEV
ncbi:MAG: HAD family hydrolase [Clostridiaceae bacterium]|nr:HAD family hydrolase [Clostridiaceae bacterium]